MEMCAGVISLGLGPREKRMCPLKSGSSLLQLSLIQGQSAEGQVAQAGLIGHLALINLIKCLGENLVRSSEVAHEPVGEAQGGQKVDDQMRRFGARGELQSRLIGGQSLVVSPRIAV